MARKKASAPATAETVNQGQGTASEKRQSPTRTETANPQPRSWRDPFNPETGAFADNIRLAGEDDLTELRNSMKQFGFIDHFPVLMDENDVVLVGHRRLKVAKELGIEPVIKKLDIGQGDAADAERLKLAIASNIGFKPMTKNDRKRIAKYLYGDREWTMERIAEALNVSTKTVSFDLKEVFTQGKNPHRPKGGRPKGSKGSKRSSKTEGVGFKPSPEQIAKAAAKQTAEAEAEARTLEALEAKQEAEIRAMGLLSEVEELKAQLAQAAARETDGEDSTGATPKAALLAAIDRVLHLAAQEIVWPRGQTKECKKLLNEVRLRLLRLHELAQPRRGS